MESDKQVEKDLFRLQDSAIDKLQDVKKDISITFNIGKARLWHQHSTDELKERLKGVERLNGEADKHLIQSENFLHREAISNEARKKYLHKRDEIATDFEEVLNLTNDRSPTNPEKVFRTTSKAFGFPLPNALRGLLGE